ncbi:MAG: PAS domain S-box protein [Candidatus Eisenbacteria bacterium]|nr:PAS domain S-box protein [Candidatus Eisenbacteria bacterium]
MIDNDSLNSVEGGWGDGASMLASVVEQSSEGLAVSDLRGKLIWLNHAFASMHGYAPDELIGKNLAIFHTPEQMPAVDRATKQVQETGSFSGEIWHLRRDGTVFPTMMQNSIYRDRAGNPIGMIGTVLDISVLKQSENALQQSEEKWRSLVEYTPNYILLVDSECRITFANRDGPGVTRAQAVGTLIFDYTDPEYHELVRKTVRQVGETGVSGCYEIRSGGPLGHDLWFEVQVGAIWNDGHASDIVLVGTDITERKRAEEALTKAERKYRELLDANPYGIQVINDSGVITYSNSAYQRMLGYTREELLGKSILDLLDCDEARDELRTYLPMLIRDRPQPTTYSQKNRTKDGRIIDQHVDWNYEYDSKGRVTGFVSVISDITEQKRTQQALCESEEKYRTAFWHSIIGLYRTTPDGCIVLANPALVKMLGYSSFDELSKRNLENFGYEPPYERSAFKNLMESQGEIIGMESAWTRFDGTFLHVRECATAIRDENGKILYYEGNVEDITDRRNIELQLEKTFNEMETRVAERTKELAEANDVLRKEQRALEAKNTALAEILDHIDAGKRQLTTRILSNITKIAGPAIQQLNGSTDRRVKQLAGVIRKTLEDITSPLLDNLGKTCQNLTPRELEICNMIKNGLTCKEIASTLNISDLTVLSKRKRIRKKLGISNKSVNLVCFLKSLEGRGDQIGPLM